MERIDARPMEVKPSRAWARHAIMFHADWGHREALARVGPTFLRYKLARIIA